MHDRDTGHRLHRPPDRQPIWGAVLLALCLLAGLPAGCGVERAAGPETRTGSVQIALPLPKTSALRVAWVEYLVAAGPDTLRGNLQIGEDGVARGTITDVPAGPARLVRLAAYDAFGRLAYAGAAAADVLPGEATRLRIVMRPASAGADGPEAGEGASGGESGTTAGAVDSTDTAGDPGASGGPGDDGGPAGEVGGAADSSATVGEGGSTADGGGPGQAGE
ncbi:MAG: hypothetical protein AB1505_19305, partial [Candidatus Latescibacterota bacterium]